MSDKINIMIVAPGPTFSTYDVFKYYLDASRLEERFNSVDAFNFHNNIYYHRVALTKLFQYYSKEEIDSLATVRAARELLIDVIINKPHIVFVVSGTIIPHEVYRELLWVRQELDRPFALALYLTECPYVNELQDMYIQYADILFVNDKYSLERYDPDRTKYVEYLPHSFNPIVHYPGSYEDGLKDGKFNSDVLFGGTAFKERLDMLANVEWNGIDLKLLGTWQEWGNTESGIKIAPYIASSKIVVSNMELADYYRGTKIALNIHRTRGDVDGEGEELDNYIDAYSIGPRLYEASACGAFILTDFRQEAADVFGDTIEFFEGSDQLSEKLTYWLAPEHEQERLNRAEAARQKISNCTFSDRISSILLPTFDEILKLRRVKNG